MNDKKKYRFTITKKLLSLFILLSIVPIFLVSLLILDYYHESRLEAQTEFMKSILENESEKIKLHWQNLHDLAEINSINPLLIGTTKKLAEYYQTDDEQYNKEIRKLKAHLEKVKSKYPFEDMIILDKKGNVLFALEDSSLIQKNVLSKEFKLNTLKKSIRNCLQTKKTTFSDFLKTDTNQKKINSYITVPLFEDDQIIGAISYGISSKHLDKFIEINENKYSTAESYIIGEDKLLRTSLKNDPEAKVLEKKIETPSSEYFFKYYKHRTSGSNIYVNKNSVNYEGVKVLSVAYLLGLPKIFNSDFDLLLINEISLEEINAPSIVLARKIIIILLIISVLVILCSLLFSKMFTKPILKIKELADLISTGDFSKSIVINDKSEIGDLANSIIRIKDSLNDTVEQAKIITEGDYSHHLLMNEGNNTLAKAIEKMTDKLREKDQFSSLIMENTQAGVVLINPDSLLIEYINPFAQSILELKENQVVNQSCKKFFCCRDDDKCSINLGEKNIETELDVILKNNVKKTILKRETKLSFADREIIILTFVDVTKINNLKNEISEKELKYRTMFIQSPSAIVMTDKDSNILDLNNKVTEWIGYTVEEVKGKNIFLLPFITDESKKTIRKKFLTAKDEENFSYPIEFINKNKEKCYGLVQVNRIKNKYNQVILSIVTIINVTKQYLALQELENQNKKFSAVFNSMGDAKFIIDGKIIIDCNDSAVSLFNASGKQDLINHSLDALFPEKQENGVSSGDFSLVQIDKAMKMGMIRFEFNHKKLTGEIFPTEVILTKVKMFDKVFIHANVRDITSRLEAQKEINKTKKMLSQIMNASSPLCSISRDFKIIGANDALMELLGYSSGQNILGKKCYEILGLQCCGTDNCFLKKCTLSNKLEIGEYTLKNVHGKSIDCSIHVNPLRNEYGEIIGIVESISDISQLKKQQVEILTKNKLIAEKNWLIKSQKRFNDEIRGDFTLKLLCKKIINFLAEFVDAQAGTIYTYNQKRNFMEFQASYIIDETICKKNYKIGNGLVGIATEKNRIMNITDIDKIHLSIDTVVGKIVPNQLLAIPFTFQNTVLGVLELATISKFTQKNINFLTSIVDDLGIAVNLAYVHQETKQLLSETQQQAAELEVQQEELRVANETLEKNSEKLKKASSDLKRQQEELRLINQELEEKSEYLEKNREEIKQKNQILEKAKAELKDKAEKLALASKYKSEFLANMSHELRTPLNSLLILSNNLAKNKKGNLTEKQVESAKIINSSGKDLLNLINEILDLSKIEAGKMTINPVNFTIDDLIQNIKRNFIHQFEKKALELRIVKGDNLPKIIYSDIQRIQQVVKNLLSNALKFTSSGFVEIKFYRPDGNDDLSKSGLDKSKAVAISVRDSGIGIKPEKVDLIFEAFQQEDGSTSRKYGGTGLGLSISSHLLQLLGGEIQVKSIVGQGSTFTIYFPEEIDENPEKNATIDTKEIKSEKSTDKGNETEAPDKVSNNSSYLKSKIGSKSFASEMQKGIDDDRDFIEKDSVSVLVIEDDLKFAEILKSIANDKGMKFLHSPNGETGIIMAKQYMPSSIILDINLPGMNGWEVLEILKEDNNLRHIPVHIMSGNNSEKKYFDKGAIGYLTKPVTTENLEKAFSLINNHSKNKISNILIVEDDANSQKVIKDVVSDKNINTVFANSGEIALEKIKNNYFDCVILDMGLPDMSGFELLKKMQNLNLDYLPPVIVYTGQDLSRSQEIELRKYTQSIVLKGDKSNERLIDEVALYLHQVVKDLPQEKQEIIRMLHNKDHIFSGKNILLVDDDIRNIFAVTGALEDYEMEVITASNGKEAVDTLLENNDIDLVLMDIMMPVMDGYEAMRAIRKIDKLKKIPIIALTAKAMQGDKDKCLEAGANDYLAKPLNVDRLISMMRIWLYKD
jgi:tubulin-specific chaperone A